MERNELYAFISRFIVQRRLYRDENVENKTATDGQRKYTKFKLLSVSVEKRILNGKFHRACIGVENRNRRRVKYNRM